MKIKGTKTALILAVALSVFASTIPAFIADETTTSEVSEISTGETVSGGDATDEMPVFDETSVIDETYSSVEDTTDTTGETDETVEDNLSISTWIIDSQVDNKKTPLTDYSWFATMADKERDISQIVQIDIDSEKVFEPGQVIIEVPNIFDKYYQPVIEADGFTGVRKDNTYIFTNDYAIEESSHIELSLNFRVDARALITPSDLCSKPILKILDKEVESNEVRLHYEGNKSYDFIVNRTEFRNVETNSMFPVEYRDYVWIKINPYITNSEGINTLYKSFYEIKGPEGMIVMKGDTIIDDGCFESSGTQLYFGFPPDSAAKQEIQMQYSGIFHNKGIASQNNTNTEEVLIDNYVISIPNIFSYQLNESKELNYSVVPLGGYNGDVNEALTNHSFSDESIMFLIRSSYSGYATDEIHMWFDGIYIDNRRMSDDEYSYTGINLLGYGSDNSIPLKKDEAYFRLYVRHRGSQEWESYDEWSYDGAKRITFKDDDIVGIHYTITTEKSIYYSGGETAQVRYYGPVQKGQNIRHMFGMEVYKILPDGSKEFRESVEQNKINWNQTGFQETREKDIATKGHEIYRNSYQKGVSTRGDFIRMSRYRDGIIMKNNNTNSFEETHEVSVDIFGNRSNMDVDFNGIRFLFIAEQGFTMNKRNIGVSSILDESYLPLIKDMNGNQVFNTIDEMEEYIKSHISTTTREAIDKSNNKRYNVLEVRFEPDETWDMIDFADLNKTIKWFKLSFPVNVTYEDYMDYGGQYKIQNRLMYIDKEPYPSNRNTATDNAATDKIDADGDGLITDKIYNSNYWVDSSYRIQSSVSSRQGISLQVQTDKSNFTTTTAEANIGSEYQYKLRITSGLKEIKDAKFFVDIESLGGWKGLFTGVDTTFAANKGYDVWVGCSSNTGSKDVSDYTELTPDTDLSSVKAICFWIKGSVEPNSLIYVLMNMKTPDSDSIYMAKQRFTAVFDVMNNGVATGTTISSNMTRVSLPSSIEDEVYGVEVWLKVKDNPAIDKENTMITITNKETGESINIKVNPSGDEIVIQGLLPGEYLIESSGLEIDEGSDLLIEQQEDMFNHQISFKEGKKTSGFIQVYTIHNFFNIK